jgi:capsule polysaccharide modification protein KpsS
MNRNKIKLKYVLNLWKSLPGYPTKEDVLYEIKSFLVRDSRPGEFSHQTLNAVFGSKWEKTEYGRIVNELIEDGLIEETKKISASKKWYTLKK